MNIEWPNLPMFSKLTTAYKPKPRVTNSEKPLFIRGVKSRAKWQNVD
jgi:hypothetical protein